MKTPIGLFAVRRPWGTWTTVTIRLDKRTYGKPTGPRLGAANSPQAAMSGASDTAPLVRGPTASRAPAEGFPLSGLSTGTLLRSLLITTISSHRLLLIPALKTLSFLARPGRPAILDVDRNPVLHAVLRKTFYDQFCTGETAAETRACVQRLKGLGFRGVILTYAKETVFDHLTQSAVEHGKVSGASSVGGFDADIEDWKRGTLETAAQIEEGDYLAIKLTGAGRAVTSAFAADELPPKQMQDALDEIATTCKQRGIKIIVDAESTHFQRTIDRVTLELMRRFNREGTAAVYNTYQAYLKHTPDNIANHLSEAAKDGFTLGLKLVRGAYILSDNRALIHDTKEDTDAAYNSISQGAVKRHIGEFGSRDPGRSSKAFPSVDLLLASHNKESLLAALELHQERLRSDLPTVPISFGQLHGMSDEVSFSLLRAGRPRDGLEGPSVFKCSTWGTMGECLAYLLRRAVENRDAVLRTTDEHRAVKSECWRRIRSVLSV
ncbi:putative proline dehydrogenase, mitochondrial [Colletotrichum tanaceti]|uniref:Proline dehydrogenase n=1 Tax=Colletotrichum tanaceti TaxID=1306861 RepID=A0A4U6X506_9PEZI|nr:putative proline dehydrogenase, mitochondrial [Colletotrichum tanaceti]KAJ0167404.1 putative proline dehydrogenase, mitochondrial [Colletotrichum tanaceti]TKW49899.1 putative proline dehydrogenase, mitochondrial [Colletotrichum tanaceti]